MGGIRGFHGSSYEDYTFLRYDAMYFVEMKKSFGGSRSLQLQFRILNMYTTDSFVTLLCIYKRYGITSQRITIHIDNDV
jgi:hypothetical protein